MHLINKWLRAGLTALSVLLSTFGALLIIMSFSETRSIADVKNTLALQHLDFMQSYAGFFPLGLGMLTYSVLLANIPVLEKKRWLSVMTLTMLAPLGTLLIASSIVGTQPAG